MLYNPGGMSIQAFQRYVAGEVWRNAMEPAEARALTAFINRYAHVGAFAPDTTLSHVGLTYRRARWAVNGDLLGALPPAQKESCLAAIDTLQATRPYLFAENEPFPGDEPYAKATGQQIDDFLKGKWFRERFGTKEGQRVRTSVRAVFEHALGPKWRDIPLLEMDFELQPWIAHFPYDYRGFGSTRAHYQRGINAFIMLRPDLPQRQRSIAVDPTGAGLVAFVEQQRRAGAIDNHRGAQLRNAVGHAFFLRYGSDWREVPLRQVDIIQLVRAMDVSPAYKTGSGISTRLRAALCDYNRAHPGVLGADVTVRVASTGQGLLDWNELMVIRGELSEAHYRVRATAIPRVLEQHFGKDALTHDLSKTDLQELVRRTTFPELTPASNRQYRARVLVTARSATRNDVAQFATGPESPGLSLSAP